MLQRPATDRRGYDLDQLLRQAGQRPRLQVFAIISRALSANDEQMTEQHTQTPPNPIHPASLEQKKKGFSAFCLNDR